MMIFEGVIVQQLLTTTELKAAQKKFDLGMIDFICYNLSLMQAFITNDIEKDKQRMKDETTSSENGKKEAKLLAGTTECLLCLIYCSNVFQLAD